MMGLDIWTGSWIYLSAEILLPAHGGLILNNRSPYGARALAGTRGIVGGIMVLGS